ncbi:hypothetical protein HA150_07190 [Prochlorococcus marinus XMU1414]|uniref:Polysaccharide chain length determinant N-terminal domain-containing protein n=1 Tax=Prochlorococcus marinus XMU1424 TaxID=2774497 RepID=A0A9D9G306_PROMR|nr:Wzz/FepE/Etk N-terminal domain-containing protein [Prochlorococcus marinus]MBO8228683.1 hypothetical protein [Prochlorococcus marinus XMU1414]MBW3046162.1 hypothetical protein [Prochlorococcus marinus str. MU1414]MCR8531546.1 Wzz/FepE/Etk N-terminal domain-containing protein [Prochlorococcus marinus XMU1420]MCR8535275.1 Wzz/FepE/Etk N-terminal domain-containing protein [Prochlorococcus marinus XMU1424]
MNENHTFDISELISTIKRHKFVISIFTSLGIALSGVYILIKKPVWAGQFQIVLQNKESNNRLKSFLNAESELSNLIGLENNDRSLETEVKILESDSVLKPVFDYVKEYKIKKGQKVQRLRYSSWVKDYLKVELEENTNVLNLEYKDIDKENVLPVINKISKEYQNYSGKDREKGIDQGLKYLEEQIITYRKKSLNSLRAAGKFAIEQDLTSFTGENVGDLEIMTPTRIEAIRVNAANRIRSIDRQLDQLERLSNDPDAVLFRGLTIPTLAKQGIYKNLDQIDLKLSLLEEKYQPNDIVISSLKEKRELLIEVLKRQTLGYLLAEKISNEAIVEASIRPEGVLVKYKELMRNALRDETTLERLEIQLQALALEKARNADPWELITTPTLLDLPVSPKKSRVLVFGLLSGTIFGIGASLIIDKKTDLIYSLDELKSILPTPFLDNIILSSNTNFEESMTLILNGKFKIDNNESIAFINIGEINNDKLEIFKKKITTFLKNKKILITKDLVKASDFDHQIILTELGSAKRSQIYTLKNQLKLQGKDTKGWILI